MTSFDPAGSPGPAPAKRKTPLHTIMDGITLFLLALSLFALMLAFFFQIIQKSSPDHKRRKGQKTALCRIILFNSFIKGDHGYLKRIIGFMDILPRYLIRTGCDKTLMLFDEIIHPSRIVFQQGNLFFILQTDLSL